MKEMKINNRQNQASQTRKKISDIAIKLFLRQGIEKTTIREICEHAGVSVGTFYIYFASKEEVVLSQIRAEDQIFKNSAILQDRSQSWKEKIINLILQWQSIKNIYDNKLVILEPRFTKKYVITESSNFFQTLNAVIAAGQMEGTIRKDFTSNAVAWRIIRFSRGLEYDWYLNCQEYNLPKLLIMELNFYLPLFEASPPAPQQK